MPHPIPRYFHARGLSVPSGIEEWELRVMRPPYGRVERIRIGLGCVPPSIGETLPGGGRARVFVVRPHYAGPNLDFSALSWLRAAIPDAAVVVEPPSGAAKPALARLLTQCSRRACVVLGSASWGPEEIVTAVRRSFDVRQDLAVWLSAVVPMWPARAREQAWRSLMEGYEHDAELMGALPSRQRPWTLAGRALKAALLLQEPAESGEQRPTLLRTAVEAGYSSAGSMSRALERHFSVSANLIRGTVGWEWLIWRFLTRQDVPRVG